MSKSHRPKLKDVHRAFLVQEFACFASPTEAAESLKQAFGVEITQQGAQHYDMKAEASKKAAKRWHELFDVARKAFLDDVEARVPESLKSVRIQELAKASRAFKRQNNFIAQAAMLEKIAKEVGGVHTNRHEFTGKGGGPIKYQEVDEMTDDQVDTELRQIFGIKADADVHPAPKSQQ